jgi:hypothetical protein
MMTMVEYAVFWTPAANRVCSSRCNEKGEENLALLLGMQPAFVAFLNRPGEKDWPMSEELKELLIKLAGPHGATVLKIYRIQKGLE